MSKVKENLNVFDEYNDIQKKIDECHKLISQLKEKKKLDQLFSMYGWNLQEVLGKHLHSKIGDKLITMIEAEVIALEAKQETLELKG
jgi:hypothetical protein